MEEQTIYKYPRTPHLPWSRTIGKDDRALLSTNHLIGKEVVVTEKMDGENSSLYNNYYHARSPLYEDHPSRHWLKQFWGGIKHEIPPGFRICGENMYAKHSIFYKELESYFLGFSIWNEERCLSWDETLEWFELLGITSVPILWRGIYDEERLKDDWKKVEKESTEGYVVRLASGFSYDRFGASVAKFVRPKHVTSSSHWKFEELCPNQLK